MTAVASIRTGLYAGHVYHKRFRPVIHELRYRVFSLYINLDDIDERAQKLRFFSRNRWNLFSFHDRDFGHKGSTLPLDEYVRQQLIQNGIDTEPTDVCLLCYPRIVGYVFNPLSIYYCFDARQRVFATIHEVHNTFHERQTYVLPVDADSHDAIRNMPVDTPGTTAVPGFPDSAADCVSNSAANSAQTDTGAGTNKAFVAESKPDSLRDAVPGAQSGTELSAGQAQNDRSDTNKAPDNVVGNAEKSTDGVYSQHCDKLMYVSPFAPLELQYRFRLRLPQERFSVTIHADDEEGPLITATTAGKFQVMSDTVLLKFLFLYPLMTFKVMAGIHWEALKLWCKRVPWFRHTPVNE